MYWCRNIWTSSMYLWMCWTFRHLWMYLLCCDVSWNYCMEIYILICCCYYFKINYFSMRLTLFSVRMATQKITFNLGERNFSMSSPRPTKKYTYFLCVYFFFLCRYPHRNFIFNLAKHNFSVRVRPTEKLFLTTNTQNNWIFLSLYFRVYFSEIHRQKIFF